MSINKIMLSLMIMLMYFAGVALAAEGDDSSELQMPSAVRGWQSAPDEAKTWAQTLMDWGATAVTIISILALLYLYIRGRFADQAGSIQTKNDSTNKMIELVIGAVILLVAIGFIWMIFWK